MSKQVVLTTGALTGIGRAAAMGFAAAGANVVVAGRRRSEYRIRNRHTTCLRIVALSKAS